MDVERREGVRATSRNARERERDGHMKMCCSRHQMREVQRLCIAGAGPELTCMRSTGNAILHRMPATDGVR
jgi:hypothetical protein